MSYPNSNYDGALISELGVKRYLKGRKDIAFSNINFFMGSQEANILWQECNFGCHGPSYRKLTRQATKTELLSSLDKMSPLVAGLADGLHQQTLGKAGNLAGGVKRTAEGLHLSGRENFQRIGEENYAAYTFAKSTFEKLLSFDISVIDNPIAQIIMTLVSEYISLLPEWLIDELGSQGALIFPDAFDPVWLIKAASLGIIDRISPEEMHQIEKCINDRSQRIIGKHLGKKLAVALSYAIASMITKKILKSSLEVPHIKRRLVRIRKAARALKGGLGTAMLTLLGAQGLLDNASASSERLKQSSQRLWQILRYELNGANMVYFLVEGIVREYVDRISLLEKQPAEFAKVMAALLREKNTPAIFFPGINLLNKPNLS